MRTFILNLILLPLLLLGSNSQPQASVLANAALSSPSISSSSTTPALLQRRHSTRTSEQALQSLADEAAHLHAKHAHKASLYRHANDAPSQPLSRSTPLSRPQHPQPQRRGGHRSHHAGDDDDDDDDDNDYDYSLTIGEIVLYNANNERFYTVISVGTPPTLAPVQFDTGSSDAWLRASLFSGSTPLNSSSPSSCSSSFTPTGHDFNISYMDGSSASGFQGLDRVELGGVVGVQTAVSVGVQVSARAASEPVAGVLGMGWPALATAKQDPYWVAADLDVFSLYLASSSDVDDPNVYGGMLMLNGVDPTFYQGDIHYVPLLRPLIGWTVALEGISVGNTSIPLDPPPSSSSSNNSSNNRRSAPSSSQQTLAALIDSGTTLISVPPAVASAFYAAIPGAEAMSRPPGFYSYPCASVVGAGFHFGGERYEVPDVVFVKAKDERPRKVDEGNYCVGSLFASSGGDDDFMILG
ncbi:hypothetical protein V8E36_008343 [Tilletia maclaganii]